MALRRWMLLLLGLMGSMLAAAALYISAEGTLVSGPQSPIVTESVMQNDFALPAVIPGTALLAERISSYDGPYLEDGSDREVVNVAALHVCNTASRMIQNVLITLQCEDALYVFYGEDIPPGKTVVLLEREGREYEHGDCTGILGWQVLSIEEELNCVTVTEQSMGTLVVTNRSDDTLHNLCLRYKSWLSPPDVYVGGITYKTIIPVLLPGQTLHLYPPHYAAGYSKIVSVTAAP